MSSTQSNNLLHVIITTPSEMLNCGKSCPKFQNEKFCSLESHLPALSKVNDITLTKVVSRNVSQVATVGRNKQILPKRKKLEVQKSIRKPLGYLQVICQVNNSLYKYITVFCRMAFYNFPAPVIKN